jgi:hypothetical protein
MLAPLFAVSLKRSRDRPLLAAGGRNRNDTASRASEQREQFQRTECRRRPLKHGKPMVDVPVAKGATVFWGAPARCMTEPVTKLSREMPVVAKTGSIGNLAESLTCAEGGPAPQKARGVI